MREEKGERKREGKTEEEGMFEELKKNIKTAFLLKKINKPNKLKK